MTWNKIKFYINELIRMYTSEKTYFSKKRIESGIAFFIGQVGMVYFLFTNITELSSSDIALWASIEFTIAGYMVSQIQKEKKENNEQ